MALIMSLFLCPFLVGHVYCISSKLHYCYQCADTSADGNCQTKIKTMAKAAGYITDPTTSDVDNDKIDLYKQFVKNCTVYLDSSQETLCVIESHEYRGQVNMFMRDCTDGVNFAAKFEAVQRPRADNQTYCDRKGDTGTYCVTMCKGDFCNGPTPSAGDTLHLSVCLLFSSVFIYMCHFLYFESIFLC
ncbi:uncharacterized protein LOC133193346 [Saccostrea echinata]|uniref:uncharacterized protein LOC133193346 n=1 Tax=Saccostrea echinata TaxID=191078 RepID=UPI002A81D29B|nr:uncharacterized protein LOC133193346 [Saccostrea echinata]